MMVTTLQAGTTQRIELHNISWETFEAMLEEMGDHRSARLAYYRGVLELMSPSSKHERVNRLLERLIVAITEALELEVYSLGSTTWKKDQLAGVEADSCFYIQNEPAIRAVEQQNREVDLSQDPPPDLVIEVDITSTSQPKFAIYAVMQVPEIWLYRSEKVEIYHLAISGYQRSLESLAFPGVQVSELAHFLKMGDARGHNATVREMRSWLRGQLQARSIHE